MTGTTKSVSPGPFTLGVNNRRPDFKLDRRTAGGRKEWFLRSAVNIDLTAEGTAKRRAGYTQVFSGSDCHSLWSNGDVALFVDYDTLYRVTGGADELVKTVVRNNLTPGRLVSYVEANGSVYYSNDIVIGRVDALGSHDNGVAPLRFDPLVAGQTGGSLPVGEYGVCFTLLNAAGEESAATIPQQVDVPESGKLVITGLPAAFPADVVALRIYRTAPNDGTLQSAAILTTETTSYTISVANALGARCPTVLMAPMPAGSIVREFNGRLLVASGSTLYYSEPYSYALMNPARNYVTFPAPITMVEPCQKGFFLAADKTYWLGGDIAQTVLDTVLPYGAVPNSSGSDPEDIGVFWMSPRGMVRGTPDGAVERLQEENVAVESAQTGAFLYRSNDGMKQALGGLFGLGGTVAAGSFMDGEIIQKATTL